MLEFVDWGLIDYGEAWERQQHLVNEVYEQKKLGVVIFCQHPEVVTCGRKTQADDIAGWTGKTIEVNRGGRATYHGPSQLVVYWVYNLKHPQTPEALDSDIGAHLRTIETCFIQTLQSQLAHQKFLGRTLTHGNLEDTGVWSSTGQKLVSIGIAVKHFVTSHGAALNYSYDPGAFQGLRPCGFDPKIMTSFEQLCLEENISLPTRTDFIKILQAEIIKAFVKTQ